MARLDGFRTLMLDSTYRPLRTIPWQRAIILEIEDRVDALEYYEEVVRTPSLALPLPAVVRLRQYLKLARGVVPFSRRNVLVRDGYSCQYCGARPKFADLTLDHVVPRCRGGLTEWENVVTACRTCNLRKGSRTLREAQMSLLRAPLRPRDLPWERAIIQGTDLPEEWAEYLDLAG